MAAPVLTPSLVKLRDALNTRCPGRDKASDGWIGDKAHQQSTSGHNPDDTPGVKAEYSDADSKPEVRAIDVDADLRCGGLTMLQVIRAILDSPSTLKRLRYIIYNRVIWSRTTNWQPRAYTGSSPHTEHAHFSGDPLDDDNESPWTVVATVGQEDDMTPAQAAQLQAVAEAVERIEKNSEAAALRANGLLGLEDVKTVWSDRTPEAVQPNVLRRALEQIHTAVVSMQPGTTAPPVDPLVLAQAVEVALRAVLPGLRLAVETPAGPTGG